jgi:isopentenyl diphosphate isomerase/L-lactate dehydrogenase-like FMN-dependent dehydrogenase
VPAERLSVHDWQREAAAALDEGALGYLEGGAGDERALRETMTAFARIRFLPRMLAGIAEPELATTVIGTRISLPVIVAPVGHQRLFHPDGEVAVARASAAAGTVMCVSTMANTSVEEIAIEAPAADLWYQLYPRIDRGHRRELVQRAEDSGCTAIVVTVDVQSLGRRERDLRSGFRLAPTMPMPNLHREGEHPGTLGDIASVLEPALSWADIDEIRSWTRLPLLLKGLLHTGDAVLAAEHGCAGVIVSNHGGRQLEGTVAPIDALPRVADAVGDRLELYVDSGVRRGVDVLAALALGARAVLLGRPAMYGLAVAGEAGVVAVLDLLRTELRNAMHLAGVASASAVPRDIIWS